VTESTTGTGTQEGNGDLEAGTTFVVDEERF
jgi:hypothetical protein